VGRAQRGEPAPGAAAPAVSLYWFNWMNKVTGSPDASPRSVAMALSSSRCLSSVLLPLPGGPSTTTAGSGTAASNAPRSS
jgi:hypothetical protein